MSDKLELKVSEACFERMVAERFDMLKTAGVLQNVGNYLKPSLTDTHSYVKAMMVPLAIGLGIKTVSELMKHRESKKNLEEADKVFMHLKRTSPYVKDNPEICMQAFDALKSFAPALAAKPIIAKTFVENAAKTDGYFTVEQAKLLADTQTTVSKLMNGGDGGFTKGLQGTMGLFKLGPIGDSMKKDTSQQEFDLHQKQFKK